MKVGHSRSNTKNSMTDSINNIQERMSGVMLAVSAKSGAMPVVSAGVRLVAASESVNKRGVLV